MAQTIENTKAVFTNMPLDTIIIVCVVLAFELYVLFICRQDVKKWVMRIARLFILSLIQIRDQKRTARRDCKRGGERVEIKR